MNKEIKQKITRNWFKLLQDVICKDIQKLENNKIKFVSKTWNRNKLKDEGGGEFRILKNGKVFDQVGVNFSEVYGKFPKKIKNKVPGTSKSSNFWASGISVVMHMKNPNIPAIHFNTRFIYTSFGWFGGGMDITPCIKDNKEKKILHNELKKMCNRHNKNYYKKYKKWCDEYFYLPHRKEPRGIGGIFFDYKKDNWEKDFKFVSDLGITFKLIFNLLINRKNKKKWTTKEKELQYIKRGRYVEFNLLYDRGTKFGLQTGGNIDAILMSLPPTAKWN
ncbi:MAG: oxygen-dependent coproporphyrinogen oxidase [Candidatus Pelagibacter sp. TMED106]|jgi:coproporphyrinogen III oxidase|nr:MAG: oxygen-dependent coproporphyrinogen oxidase [Candidatus Pelagibacter sp. TMED106]|tara:strand:+ start:1158 stop:1985 length:828 start_codon:yes stop_codon:yes gene_type:complete